MSERESDAPLPRVRLDKWLWAARFYKTRALACDAIETGYVRVAGERSDRDAVLAVPLPD